jgi:hypothetical protein
MSPKEIERRLRALEESEDRLVTLFGWGDVPASELIANYRREHPTDKRPDEAFQILRFRWGKPNQGDSSARI